MTAERSEQRAVPFSARVVKLPLTKAKTVAAMLRAAGADEWPFALVGAWGGKRALIGSDPLLVVEGCRDPFALVDQQPKITAAVPGATGGGWVGYLGYGLGGQIERLPDPPRRPVPVPSSLLAFYDHVLALDNAGQWWFEALWSNEQSERLERRLESWKRRASEPEATPGRFECGPFRLNPGPDAHLVAVSRAIEHIRSGDVFQVNVCTRLEAAFSGEPVELFCRGLEGLAPRYGAFLSHESVAIASFSPELFLKRQERRVLSSPIKGTARRDPSSVGGREQLLGSEKDRAENLMIVDLMRNDLGRVCRYGTVFVPELYRAEEHPGVWHLVSDVAGELRKNVSDSELLRASFPPGSVTGAPKVRAMELVARLEGTAREVYTGAIGIASPLTGLELSVAIRTFELTRDKAWLGVGGGVVADSDPASELEECLDKARPLLAAIGASLAHVRETGRARGVPTHVDVAAGVFETILVVDGRPVELEAHLGRLAASATTLYGSPPSPRLGTKVADTASGKPGPWRLRVRVQPGPKGDISCDVSILEAPEAFSGASVRRVRLVPALAPGGLGRHKWQDRRVLTALRRGLKLEGVDQLLIVDEDGSVLETELANVFVVLGGAVHTPPVDGRSLAGTTREAVIALAKTAGLEVSIHPIRLGELALAEEIFISSSIRGLCAVGELRGEQGFETGPVSVGLSSALWASWCPDFDATARAFAHELDAHTP